MDRVLKGFGDFVRAYMDDLVVFSYNWDEHMQHVRQVLQALRKTGLTVNPNKCHWGVEKLEFLGHVIGKGVVSVPQTRASAIRNYVKPKTNKGLRAFLGTVSYYRKFMDKLTDHTAGLSPATSKAAPSKIE